MTSEPNRLVATTSGVKRAISPTVGELQQKEHDAGIRALCVDFINNESTTQKRGPWTTWTAMDIGEIQSFYTQNKRRYPDIQHLPTEDEVKSAGQVLATRGFQRRDVAAGLSVRMRATK